VALGGTNFKLRCSTNNDPYASFEITAAVVYTAGQMVLYEDTVCVVVGTVAIGGQAVLVYKAAKIIVPCQLVTTANLANMNEGCKIYFDAADANVNVDTGNTLCGIVTVQPALAATEVEIHLDGMLGITS